MKLTEFLSDIGRPVAYHPGIKRITGSTTATILLCQLIYWTGKQADPDGWIYKTSAELEEETGLTYLEQTTARKVLIARGLIEEIYKRLDHQMKFRVMADAIEQEWGKRESYIPESGNATLGKMATPRSFNREAENTAENTADILTQPSAAPTKSPDPLIKKKTKKPSTADPRSTHPAIQAIRELMHLYPPRGAYDDVILILGETPNVKLLTKCYAGWCMSGYKPTSLKWLDWYTAGGVPQYSKNGTSRPGSGNPVYQRSDPEKVKACREEIMKNRRELEAQNAK